MVDIKKKNLIRAEEDILLDFQGSILSALQDVGITQAEFAKRLGVSKARVSQLLSSDANPTIKQVGRCLTVLNKGWDFRAPHVPERVAVSDRRVPQSRKELFALAATKQIQSAHEWNAETSRAANENFATRREAA